MYGSIVKTEIETPILQDFGFSVVGKPKVVFLIAHLLYLCRPAAIGWIAPFNALIALTACVMLERVHSVDRVLGAGAPAHVSQESLKGFAPAIADVVTNSTVPAVSVLCGFVAAIEHPAPDAKFNELVKPMLRGWRDASALSPIDVPLQVAGRHTALPPTHGASKEPSVIAVGLLSADRLCKEDERTNCVARLKTFGTKDTLALRHEKFLSSEGCLCLEPTGVSAPARLASFYDKKVQG
jgi:hypothetical protein